MLEERIDEDASADGDYIDAGDKEWNYITDAQFSVIALISDSDSLVGRIVYTPYGVARHSRAYDVDGDGDADSADNTILQGATYGKSIGHADYNVDADFDRDGDVDSADVVAFTTGQAQSPGQISAVDNPIGYDVYVFNDEMGPGYDLYTVRHRSFSPDMGRWVERDPAQYVDGLHLYEFALSNPTRFDDPYGLASTCTTQTASSGCTAPSSSNPCKAMESAGCNPRGDCGAVLCVNNQATICVFNCPEVGPEVGPPTEGQDIVRKCVRAHENTHLNDIDCSTNTCPSGLICRPPFKPGLNPNKEECDGYKIERTCLNLKLHACTTPRCTSEVNDRLNFVNNEITRRGC